VILGIGADLCRVERIRRSITRFGDSWIDHLFSAEERRLCYAAADPVLLFARGFCGKEACAKALGTGLSDGIDWRDLEVLQSRTGVTLRVAGAAHERLVEFTPQGRVARIQISCSDDRELAQAFVVVSALRL
jgi:holo-[acyl-carrier protein] synthase